jgi:septal ring factor EnvC (AmiA/AmiB activator)
MNQAGKAMVVFAIAAMGLWGCAQGPAGGGASAERLRALEAKVTKLEDDFRGAVAARDQLRKKLTTTEEEKSQLAKQVDQLVLVAKERDELKVQLSARTNERDTLQNQYNDFRKGIKTLLGQTESPSSSSMPITLSVDPALGGKS